MKPTILYTVVFHAPYPFVVIFGGQIIRIFASKYNHAEMLKKKWFRYVLIYATAAPDNVRKHKQWGEEESSTKSHFLNDDISLLLNEARYFHTWKM